MDAFGRSKDKGVNLTEICGQTDAELIDLRFFASHQGGRERGGGGGGGGGGEVLTVGQPQPRISLYFAQTTT